MQKIQSLNNGTIDIKYERQSITIGKTAGENNSSADGGNTGQWKMKQRLEITGS